MAVQASCNGLAGKKAEKVLSRVFAKKMTIFSPNYAPCGRFFKNDRSDARFTISLRGPRLCDSSCRRRIRLRTVCWLTWRIFAVIAVEKNSPGGSLGTRVCGRTGGMRISLPNTESGTQILRFDRPTIPRSVPELQFAAKHRSFHRRNAARKKLADFPGRECSLLGQLYFLPGLAQLAKRRAPVAFVRGCGEGCVNECINLLFRNK